jgi:large subunit ribosomal protein L4
LSLKAKDNNIIVMEDPKFDAPKTKAFLSLLSNLGVSNDKATLVLGDSSYNAYLSARNIPNANVAMADKINIFDIMNSNKLILAESAIKTLEENLTHN